MCLDQIGAPMHIHDCPRHADLDQRIEQMIYQCFRADLDQRFGCLIGEGPHTCAKSGGEHHSGVGRETHVWASKINGA